MFTTSMYGYPELLTDPSYRGQILVIAQPLVGNYGVPVPILNSGILENFESENIQIRGLVVAECTDGMRWDSWCNLSTYLGASDIPAIEGIDTRALVRLLRIHGTMNGIIAPAGRAHFRDTWEEYDSKNFCRETMPRQKVVHNPESKSTVAVLDFGVKHGILRALAQMGYRIARVPPTLGVDALLSEEPLGIVISNGPGNPNLLSDEVGLVKELLECRIPILGICLGHQLISMALGCSVTRLGYGHRGTNRAVLDLTDGGKYITSHNHGYAIKFGSAPASSWRPWFVALEDGTIEGCLDDRKPIMSVQFHPESRPGTNDTQWVFERFRKIICATAEKDNFLTGGR